MTANNGVRFINNEWVEGVDKKTFAVINPATEEVITSVSEATEKDVDIAVAAARKAFEGSWREITPQQRGIHMTKLADLIEKNLTLLAAVESLDNGKSITMAKGDVGAVAACIRYYAGWTDKIVGKTIDIAPNMFHYTKPEPVCFCLYPNTSPWALHNEMLTTQSIHSLVFAARSSPGTSPFSCLLGRSGLRSRLATPLS